MQKDIEFEPYEPAIVHGSQIHTQHRLFSDVSLGALLRQHMDHALRQFAFIGRDHDADALIEVFLERFEFFQLCLEDNPSSIKERVLSDGSVECEYAWHFDGNPILWYCSPSPIDDVLPSGNDVSCWTELPGETMHRPYGEFFRNKLIMISPDAPDEANLHQIRAFIEWQGVMINKAHASLETELRMLAHSFGDMDPELFAYGGFSD